MIPLHEFHPHAAQSPARFRNFDSYGGVFSDDRRGRPNVDVGRGPDPKEAYPNKRNRGSARQEQDSQRKKTPFFYHVPS
jgi:hypothetical protein